MADERTVLDHLTEGRDALRLEVERLSAAIAELDSVLGRIGSLHGAASALSAPPAPAAQPAPAWTTGGSSGVSAAATPVPVVAEPVNPPVEVEADTSRTVPSRPRAAAPRRTPAKRATTRSGRPSEPPKSIRVHVLDMLAAEGRDVGLAEIIDNVHEAGIQAHDDAVRSITIKLMKDGKVERVGRGRYRLARRGAGARASAAVATAPRVTEAAPEPVLPAESTNLSSSADSASAGYVPATGGSPWDEGADAPSEAAATSDTADTADASGSSPTSESSPSPESTATDSSDGASASSPAYIPPLNLGQPWR